MKVTVFGSMLVLVACVEQPAIDNADLESPSAPKPAVNALTPAQLFNSSINANTLDTANATAMAQTSDDRTTLTYAIGCALAPGHDIDVNVGAMPYTLSGSFGLADSWTESPLTAEQRQSVSSCVLARLNEYGLSVKISLRGVSSALAVSRPDLANYTLQEGAFFGAIFDGFARYYGTCKGTGTAPWQRQCAQPGPSGTGNCGLDYTGLCSQACTLQNGYYMNCLGSNSVRYMASSTTTYLAP
jgi:hypothetical protein